MSDTTLHAWLESLAAKQPTPGGGGAAALAAATAAALSGMVANYTTGLKWHDRETQMSQIADEAASLRLDALRIMHDDETAFQAVGAAYALPKNTEAQKLARANHIQLALQGAAKPPMETAIVAGKVLDMCKMLADLGNQNVISDVAVSASFARTALESAIVNIEINEHALNDVAVKEALVAVVKSAEINMSRADKIVIAVRERIKKS